MTAFTVSLLLVAASLAQEKSEPVSPVSKSTSSFDEVAQLADDARKTNHLDDAVKLYRKALQIRPMWAEGWGYLAASLYSLDLFQEAHEAYQKTTVLTPKNGPSWAFLGLCDYELHDYRRAFDHLFKSEQLGLGADRDLIAQVKYHLAILWTTAGQFELGLTEISWFPQQNLGSPEILEAIGLSVLHLPWFPYEIPQEKHELVMIAGAAGFAENSHQPDKARTLYEQVVATYPAEHNVHYAYGRFLATVDPDAALREYEKELEITTAHVPARIEAGYLYLKMGQLDKGLTYAREAESIEPKNSLPHNLMGRILVELGKTAEGIPELVQATRLAPNNPEFHLNLARAYQKAGNREAAAKELSVFDQIQKRRAAEEEDKKRRTASQQPPATTAAPQ